jgi:CDP-glucose 4,6-dehydratase
MATIDPGFWAQQRVLVTGHTGFKGAWLSLWLQQLGAEVTGLALDPATSPSLFSAARVASGMKSLTGDITVAADVAGAVEAAQPTVILHLAAQAIVRRSYEEPVATFATNVVGTANVLDAARAAPDLAAVVSVTSDKCYENREWPWGYREDEAMGGHDPYSASKGCAELVTAAMRRSFFDQPGMARIASARAGNVIGGGDWADNRLIPDIVRSLSVGEEIVIRRPDAVRPWQHVLEPLAGYLLLAQRLAVEGGAYADGWNFGPFEADTQPVSWVVERMVDGWGGSASWRIERDGPHEAALLRLDSAKARARLGWRPQLGIEQVIDWVVAWYQAYYQGGSARELTAEQIDRYQELMTS